MSLDTPPDDPREREQLLSEIRVLGSKLERLGVNFRDLKNTAQAIAISSQSGRNSIPKEVLEASRAELTAVLIGFQLGERAHVDRVFNLRMATCAAVLALGFGGAIIQRAFDPIGKVHAYLTTPADEITEPAEPAPELPNVNVPVLKPKIAPQIAPQASPQTPSVSPRPPTVKPVRPAPLPVFPRFDRAKPRQPRQPRQRQEIYRGPVVITELNDANFETQTAKGYWAVDFTAGWCGACRTMKPIFEKMSQEYGNRIRFGTVNVDDNHVRTPGYPGGIPYFAFLFNGREIEGFGPVKEGRFKGALDRLLAQFKVNISEDPTGGLLE